MAAPKKIEVFSEVRNGRLVSNRDLIASAIAAFEGRTIKITVSQRYRQRTNSENRYYWGVIIEHWKHIIREQWGEIWGKEDVHNFLKTNLNYEEKVDETTGLVLRKPRSTSENTTHQQEEFHKACRDLAWNMFEYQIPLPNQDFKAEFN